MLRNYLVLIPGALLAVCSGCSDDGASSPGTPALEAGPDAGASSSHSAASQASMIGTSEPADLDSGVHPDASAEPGLTSDSSAEPASSSVPDSSAAVDGAVPTPADPSSRDAETDAGATAACITIGAACAEVEDGLGLGALCQEVSHAADAEECGALVDECTEYCPTAPRSSLEDAGMDAATELEPLSDASLADAGQDATVPLSEEACELMGDRCHDLDEGHGLGHLCHEVGHQGNLTWCAAIYEECTLLCGN